MPIGTLMNRRLVSTMLLGWALFYSRHGTDWRREVELASEGNCERAMDARVNDETLAEIGGALAAQSPDNPMRQEAYRHAERHVRERYRCERLD